MENKRIDEIKAEIEAINAELADIEKKVKENPNYDAESIRRTGLNSAKYNLQKELNSEIEKTKAVEEIIKKIEAINARLAEIEAKVKEDPNYDAESIERTKLNVAKYNLQQQLKMALTKLNSKEPIKTEPIKTKSEETKPEETKPEETKPEKTKPEETKPEETKPEETKPEETKPEETKPEEPKPEEPKPEETKPEEPKPEEPKPEEPKPEETKPKKEEPKKDEQYNVGFWANLILRFTNFIKRHIKIKAILDACAKLEESVLSNAKALPESLDDVEPKKLKVTVKDKTDDKSKNEDKEPIEAEEEEESEYLKAVRKQDHKWYQKKLSTAKEDELFSRVKAEKDNEGTKDGIKESEYDKYIESEVLQQIIDLAEQTGVDTADPKTKLYRPMNKIYNDLAKKVKMKERESEPEKTEPEKTEPKTEPEKSEPKDSDFWVVQKMKTAKKDELFTKISEQQYNKVKSECEEKGITTEEDALRRDRKSVV